MITEISPIFGLNLLELIEWIMIATPIAIIISAIVTGVFSYRSINQSKTQAKQSREQIDTQLKLQNNIASAQLVWSILEYWREEKHDGFTNFLMRLHRSEIKEDDRVIGVVLGIFEDIAIWWKEGTLTDNHVKEFFGNPLVDIRDNKIMQERITKSSKKNPDFIFVNLRALLEETLKWKI